MDDFQPCRATRASTMFRRRERSWEGPEDFRNVQSSPESSGVPMLVFTLFRDEIIFASTPPGLGGASWRGSRAWDTNLRRCDGDETQLIQAIRHMKRYKAQISSQMLHFI